MSNSKSPLLSRRYPRQSSSEADRILRSLFAVEREELGGWLVYDPERRRFHLEAPDSAILAIFPERIVLRLQQYGFLRPGSRGWVLAQKGRQRLGA